MTKFCPACGVEADPVDSFCGECGHDLAPPQAQDPVKGKKTTGKPPASSSKRNLAIIGLITVSVALLAVGGYLVMQQDDRGSTRITSKPLPPVKRNIAPPPPKPRKLSEGETLKAQLVGKSHRGALNIKGWEDLGGGLMTDRLSWAYYRRPGGSWLILAETRGGTTSKNPQPVFRVADVLFIPQLGRGQEISFDCRYIGQRQTQRIISVIQPDRNNEKEWWRDIRQSWQVSKNDGRIIPISSSGIECVNESWGL